MKVLNVNISKSIVAVLCIISEIIQHLNCTESSVDIYSNNISLKKSQNQEQTKLYMKKNLMYFYNYDSTKVEVNLQIKHNIAEITDIKDKIYQINKNNLIWKINIIKDNKVSNNIIQQQEWRKNIKKKSYKYLNWAASSTNDMLIKEFNKNFDTLNKFYIFSRAQAIYKLPKLLAKKGLNKEEIIDLLDHWESYLKTKKYVKISFLSKSIYDMGVEIKISSTPEINLRIFMLIKPVDSISNNIKSAVDNENIYLEDEVPINRESFKNKKLIVQIGLIAIE